MEFKVICPNLTVSTLSELPVIVSKSYELKAFDELTILFLNEVSRTILSNPEINRLPEITALGFWLRKSNILKLRDENNHLLVNKHYLASPLGKVLHICPANVDTMFFYSLAVSLLMGNKNILRISKRVDSIHVFQLFTTLNNVMNEEAFTCFNRYINIVSYGHDDEISNFLSENVNGRIIWGGDQTISLFKKFRTKPRVKDIAFADRVSMLLIDSKAFIGLGEAELKLFFQSFFNDAYTFDQMGCSSPQTIYFLGNEFDFNACISKFLEVGTAYIQSKYQADFASIASLKLNRMIDDTLDSIIHSRYGNGLISLVLLQDSANEVNLHGCGGGYFYTRRIDNVLKLSNLNDAKIQTLCYWGIDQVNLNLLHTIASNEGIDRIVPLGEALNFHYIWDGYNLFDELSRKVFIK